MVIHKSTRKKQFWSQAGNKVTERTARIDHQCDECYGDIVKGEKYREITGDDGDNHWTKRICKDCWGKI